jgi:hypothetical protein
MIFCYSDDDYFRLMLFKLTQILLSCYIDTNDSKYTEAEDSNFNDAKNAKAKLKFQKIFNSNESIESTYRKLNDHFYFKPSVNCCWALLTKLFKLLNQLASESDEFANMLIQIIFDTKKFIEQESKDTEIDQNSAKSSFDSVLKLSAKLDKLAKDILIDQKPCDKYELLFKHYCNALRIIPFENFDVELKSNFSNENDRVLFYKLLSYTISQRSSLYLNYFKFIQYLIRVV